jgi:hypothetical protein
MYYYKHNGFYLRLYPDGEVVHEDDFHLHDEPNQLYDDYGTYFIPNEGSLPDGLPKEILEYLSDHCE